MEVFIVIWTAYCECSPMNGVHIDSVHASAEAAEARKATLEAELASSVQRFIESCSAYMSDEALSGLRQARMGAKTYRVVKHSVG